MRSTSFVKTGPLQLDTRQPNLLQHQPVGRFYGALAIACAESSGKFIQRQYLIAVTV